MQKPLPLPRTVNPALSKGTEAVLLKALAKLPEDRYPDVTSFTNALADPSAHTAVTARRATPVAAGAPRDRRPLIAGAIAAVVLVAAGIAFAATRSGEPSVSGSQQTAAPIAAATSASTAAPTATAATTAATAATQKKGALLFTAKLDPSVNEIGQQHIGPDNSFGSLKTVPGAIEMNVAKSGGQVAMLMSYKPPSDYVAEYDLQLIGSNTNATITLRSGPDGGYEVALNGQPQTIVLRRLDCSAGPGQCNVQPIGSPMSSEFGAGKTVTIGVTVQGSTISLWVDGKAGPTISNAAASGAPAIIAFSVFGNEGALRLVGLRVYAPPS